MPPTPGIKRQLPVCPVECWLKLMVCKGCWRPASEWCAGCRTVSRIKFLWTQQIGPFEEAPGLSSLRECAGLLSDLAEARGAFLRAAPQGEVQIGGTQGASPAPSQEVKKDVREPSPEGPSPEKVDKKTKEKKDKTRKEGRREEKYKDRKRRKKEKRRKEPKEGKKLQEVPRPEPREEDQREDETEEESEEEEPRERDPPLTGRAEGTASGSEPLGLTPIGAKLSPPTPEGLEEVGGRHHGRAGFESGEPASRRGDPRRTREKGDKEQEDPPRRHRPSRGSARPASPPRSPRRERSPRRRRSPSKQRKGKFQKSKGAKKRERGRDWWKNIRASNQQWRQKRREE